MKSIVIFNVETQDDIPPEDFKKALETWGRIKILDSGIIVSGVPLKVNNWKVTLCHPLPGEKV